MLNLVRTLVLGGILSLGMTPPSVWAVPSDTSRLEFLGFRAGARLEDLDSRLRRLGGPALRCRRSRIDPRVTECRATLDRPEFVVPVDMWVSAIDSVAGVLTISATLREEQLDRWRRYLQDHYGTVGPKIQGSQRMLQWVRQGRMLRLTWRLEGPTKVASVSLVDGRVLDDWGRSQTSSPALHRSKTASQPKS
ncbi:MAG TPA: hypothetical protein VFH40_08845 [Gemmatimonadales bacterium]|nr:hypothetical protein [Gemmatimonadales bacterium]